MPIHLLGADFPGNGKKVAGAIFQTHSAELLFSFELNSVLDVDKMLLSRRLYVREVAIRYADNV